MSEVVGDQAYAYNDPGYANASGGFHMYSLTFTGNPGYLKPIEIDTTLDGVRTTTNSTTAIWSDGMSGEFTDYFATQCEHVYATIDTSITSAINKYGEIAAASLT